MPSKIEFIFPLQPNPIGLRITQDIKQIELMPEQALSLADLIYQNLK